MERTTWHSFEDWEKQIDTILAAGGNGVLQTSGHVTAEEAKEHAETEFEKFRIVQDRLFQSDFDKYLGELPFIEEDDWLHQHCINIHSI